MMVQFIEHGHKRYPNSEMNVMIPKETPFENMKNKKPNFRRYPPSSEVVLYFYYLIITPTFFLICALNVSNLLQNP